MTTNLYSSHYESLSDDIYISTSNNIGVVYVFKFKNMYGASLNINVKTNEIEVDPIKFVDEYYFKSVKINNTLCHKKTSSIDDAYALIIKIKDYNEK